jgi:signal transduction histidine kinase/ActR/RegA family two-component response regulator
MDIFLKVKNRALLLVTLIIVVLSGFYLYEGIRDHNSLVESAIRDQENLIDNISGDILRFSFHPYLYKIDHFVKDNPEIRQAFADRDRERLFELCLPELAEFREENQFFHAMDFNLPDGTVFLRVQNPELFGDNIAGSREIVADVHANREQRSGFDIGKHGAIYWVSQPVFQNDAYLGAVEFGIEVKQLEKALGHSLKSDVTSVLKTEEWQKAELIHQGFQDFGDYVLMTRGDTLFDQVSAEVDFSVDSDQQIVLDGRKHILHSAAFLSDYRGKVIGRLILFLDISSRVQEKQKFVVQSLLVSSLLIVLSFMILYYSFGTFIGRLEQYAQETSEAREQLEKARNMLEERVEERTVELTRTNKVLKEEIRERRKMERKLGEQGKFLENILESLTHPFYVIDTASYVVVMANRAACELLGEESYQGRTCYSMTHNSEHPCSGVEHPCPLKDVKKKKKPAMVEHVHSDHDGNEHVYEIYAYPIFDKFGNVSQVVEYNVEITGKKKAEEEQEKLKEQLVVSQKMEAVGILAGGVAHDFNNILTTVLGYSQIMVLKLDEQDPMREMAEEIYDAAERAAGLTRQLLAFSRKQVMEMKVTSLNEIVGNISKMLGRLIREDISMHISVGESIGRVRVDVGQVEQVIMNLVINARDAMPEGGELSVETGLITLDEKYTATHTGVKPGTYAVMTVTDTGEGMTREVQEKIFEPFFTTKKLGKGTGLGLATVYGIVKQHEGHIYVYSEPGRGTTFKIYFPVVSGAVDEMRPARELKTMPRGTETIMVVDDDAAIRRLVRDALEPLGYDIIEAGSGEDALALFSRTEDRISLVLSDLVMAGINGQEMIEILTQDHPEVKTILMSGYTDNIIVQHGVLKPGVIFLNKPILPVALANKIREVLDGMEETASPAV